MKRNIRLPHERQGAFANVQVFFPRRYLATNPQSHPESHKPPSDVPKKPKSTTSLRRSASDSLPIRSTKTPTRSEIQPVFTLSTAERYLLSRIGGHPNPPAHSQVLHESWWIPKWGSKDREGEIFVFANGSFVCWGLGEADARKFAQEVIMRVPGIEVAPLKEVETEELEFVTDPIELGGAYHS